MSSEATQQPNPPPMPSRLPDTIAQLCIKPYGSKLDRHTRQSLKDFQNAACHIAAAMIFLKDNILLERDLTLADIKPRLLGHWGTCPGLILIWSHINLLIQTLHDDIIFVIGPGHGAPAALASLWLEGSLSKFYTDTYPRDSVGLHNLISKFSTPCGFPSHINAETPGAVHEGGELGYALAVSFGAVMDKPNLIAVCVVGDGEAETGPTAAAWHAIKYLDPAESGAVLPILHVNGFKISERTIFGCMDDRELACLFSGYGYQVCIVDDLYAIDGQLHTAMVWAINEIKEIQAAARARNAVIKPRWPLIILRTPKGWTGPKMIDGDIVEGSFRSHQVPIPDANKDEKHLEALQSWLQSYDVGKMLPNGQPCESIVSLLPSDQSKRLGQRQVTFDQRDKLKMPNWQSFAVQKGDLASSMATLGPFLRDVSKSNPSTFRIFSPDELESNKLTSILEDSGRNFQWDQYSCAQGGRVIEILSEHTCQGFMQGYTLTGRTALFPSYESFLGIVHTMMAQYSKWIKVARGVPWRGDLSSINYIETSTWARQEHNGFSHQQPSFIGAMLNLKAEAARVYLPPDANCLLSTVQHCLESKNYINLVVGSKQPTFAYLSEEEAAQHCQNGVSIWPFASNDDGKPDIVLVGIGVEVTFEVIKASELLQKLLPDLRIRVINVTDLMVLAMESSHPHALTQAQFIRMFTPDCPVLFNYHGYKTELQGLLFGRPGLHRMHVEGYKEEGTTTTPFDMMLANKLSRFNLADTVLSLRIESETDEAVQEKLAAMREQVTAYVQSIKDFISKEGKDPEDIYDYNTFS